MDSTLHPLTVVGIRQQDEQKPLLLLEDEHGRQLEIPIGLCESLAIQLALEQTKIGRPLTHDLLLVLADRLRAPVKRVVIDDLSQGTFFARLILDSLDGEIGLDCRPSDGIAVALRAHVPIMATEEVIAGEGHE
ncbi:MAG: bifunctional nuclease family protein [Armatimonadota bacterium]